MIYFLFFMLLRSQEHTCISNSQQNSLNLEHEPVHGMYRQTTFEETSHGEWSYNYQNINKGSFLLPVCHIVPQIIFRIDWLLISYKIIIQNGTKPQILANMNLLYLWVCSTCLYTIKFSSVAQSRMTLCDPMDCSTSGFPVHHQLLELAQTQVHQVSDAIQLSHPLLSPSLPTFNLSQHQALFK